VRNAEALAVRVTKHLVEEQANKDRMLDTLKQQEATAAAHRRSFLAIMRRVIEHTLSHRQLLHRHVMSAHAALAPVRASILRPTDNAPLSSLPPAQRTAIEGASARYTRALSQAREAVTRPEAAARLLQDALVEVRVPLANMHARIAQLVALNKAFFTRNLALAADNRALRAKRARQTSLAEVLLRQVDLLKGALTGAGLSLPAAAAANDTAIRALAPPPLHPRAHAAAAHAAADAELRSSVTIPYATDFRPRASHRTTDGAGRAGAGDDAAAGGLGPWMGGDSGSRRGGALDGADAGAEERERTLEGAEADAAAAALAQSTDGASAVRMLEAMPQYGPGSGTSALGTAAVVSTEAIEARSELQLVGIAASGHDGFRERSGEC
jgi:hypothetical protein